MNQPILHIVKSGEKIPVPFASLLHELTEEGNNTHRPKTFFTEGGFGKLLYKQVLLPFGVFNSIHLNNNESVEIAFHSVSENVSIFFARTGYFRLKTDDFKTELVAQNQARYVFAESGTTHILIADPTTGKEFVFFNIEIPLISIDAQLMAELGRLISRQKTICKLPGAFTSTPDFQKSIATVSNQLQNSQPDFSQIRASTSILLLEMIRQSERQRMSDSTERWDPDKHAVYSMAESIILGLDEEITIKKFATAQHLNPNRLKILFRKHMGMPAAAFRISVRMQKAQQLLTETNLSIHKISTLVGYCNPAQFSTMFKRKMGCSPNQLRKSLSRLITNSLHGC